MEQAAAGQGVDWLAIVAAAAAAWIFAALWYSPLLWYRAWLAAARITEADVKAANPAIVYGLSFVVTLVGAAVFALFLGPAPALPFALGAGFGAGLAWVAGAFAINYLFERRSFTLFLINGSYHTLQYTIIGAVLGLWH